MTDDITPQPFLNATARWLRWDLEFLRPGEAPQGKPIFAVRKGGEPLTAEHELPGAIEIKDDSQIKALPSFDVPGARHLMANMPRDKAGRIGKCIYCGATEFNPGSGVPLSEEHIVPEGLGARLVLEQASCEACSNVTKRFERGVLSDMLITPRRHLAIRRKRRRRSVKEEAKAYLLTVQVDGKDVEISLPPDAHPAMLHLIRLDTPGILIGRARDISGLCGLWAKLLGGTANVTAAGFPKFSSPVFDTVYFCQMLAKIAHGLAVSLLGADGFQPYLLQAIRHHYGRRENWESRYHWVGGDLTEYAPSRAQHVLTWHICALGATRFLAVAIRLFANLGAPVYQVVIGELNPAQLGRARALGVIR